MADIVVNTQSLESLLRTFAAEHTNIQNSASALRRDLEAAEWRSPRAEEFRTAWRDRYEPVLRDLCASIQTYQQDVREQLARYRMNEGQS